MIMFYTKVNCHGNTTITEYVAINIQHPSVSCS